MNEVEELKNLLRQAIATDSPAAFHLAKALDKALDRETANFHTEAVIKDEPKVRLTFSWFSLYMFLILPYLAIAQSHSAGYSWPTKVDVAATLSQPKAQLVNLSQPFIAIVSNDVVSEEVKTIKEEKVRIVYVEKEAPADVVPKGGTVKEAERVVADTSGAKALVDTAVELQLPPAEFIALMSWESGGTLNPNVKGGDFNLYEGLIQFSPENAKRYGAEGTKTIAEQAPAIKKYLLARGFKPGEHDIRHAYSAILVGTADENYVDPKGRLAWDVPDSNTTTVRNATPKFSEGAHFDRANKFLEDSGVVIELVTEEELAQEEAPAVITEEPPEIKNLSLYGEEGEEEFAGISYDLTEPEVGMAIAGGFVTSLQSLNRIHPVTGKTQPHRGVDWAKSSAGGEPYYAPGDINVKCWYDNSGGGYVAEFIFDNLTWQLLHLQKDTCVSGDVKKGSVIGNVGNSGVGTSAHAHVQIRGVEDRDTFYSVRKGHLEAVLDPNWGN